MEIQNNPGAEKIGNSRVRFQILLAAKFCEIHDLISSNCYETELNRNSLRLLINTYEEIAPVVSKNFIEPQNK